VDVQSIRQWVRSHGVDALLVLAAVEGGIELAMRRHAADAPRSALWFEIVAVAVLLGTILGRRRLPFASPATFWTLAAAASLVDGRLIPFLGCVYLAGMVTALLLGNLADARQAWIGLAIVLSAAAIIVNNMPDRTARSFVFVPLLFGICWLGGFALRARAEQARAAEQRATQAERDRDTAARIAVAEERARIARELHDIVAHSVSVMVLQVGAVRHNLPQARSADADALRGVEQTGRNALAEMRRLLGAMRASGDEVELTPQPGLDGLHTLLDDVERAGLPVDLHVDGQPVPLARAIDLSAYRIVQEGLTNALKHARATHADVTVRYEPELLCIEVRDDGSGMEQPDGYGHGLIGVRERVKIYGGRMAAGPAAGGGFVLTTQLPLSADQR
jgi:signal transduction histidine kinase